ncbi:hypothetical protein K1T73_09190 [Roseovarius sp. SCSIO 43702]|uniref:hypothetical protein n=1 Tax=Roseovarius sp. SCSIO 43702 TaxID=2823043 RepID=UPI001C73B4D4|nr:hypothetical protein [Roseovarius sp. SCSIO 43702]QYX55294.1 hypothetical protein K1T73_09190 [Roseovarius sp. SCSIO 43702]
MWKVGFAGGLTAAFVAGAAMAESDAAVRARLAGHAVVYAGPEERAPTQRWSEDGTTVYDTQVPVLGKRRGLWKIDDGEYCSYFGPTEDMRQRNRDWTCWRVSFPDARTVVFTAPPGPWIGPRRSVGRFTR